MKALKVQIEKTTRTDLMCIACGGFRTEFAIVPEGFDPCAGVHRACIERVHVRRAGSAEKEEVNVNPNAT